MTPPETPLKSMGTAYNFSAPEHINFSERLKLLMMFRVILITILLGSAYIFGITNTLDPSYLNVIGPIIATYILTLFYIFLYKYNDDHTLNAYTQFTGDALIIGVLIHFTGNTESVFVSIFFLIIITAGSLIGRRGGLAVSSLCSLVFVYLIFIENNLVPAIVEQPDNGQTGSLPAYNAMLHFAAFFIVGYLSGYLAEQLGVIGTELKQHKLDLKELRTLNRHILSSLRSGLLTTDLKTCVTYLNPAACKLLAVSNISSFGCRVEQVMLGIKIPLELKESSYNEEVRWESVCQKPNGSSICLGLTASRLFDSNQQHIGYIITFQDLTLQKEMEQKLQQQKHLVTVGKLAAGIAHEIRNPLASISGSIELLASFRNKGDAEDKLMNIVLREIERLNHLITEFLDYARPARRTLMTVDFLSIVKDTLVLFRNDKRKLSNIRIKTEMDSNPILIDGDAERLKQVIWNIFANAVEAMHNGGELFISTFAIFNKISGPKVIMNVADTGEGMSEEVLFQLFEPFFTTKDGGTGLGLATAIRIVNDHNGIISVCSIPGKGTDMTLMLETKKLAQDSSEFDSEHEQNPSKESKS